MRKNIQTDSAILADPFFLIIFIERARAINQTEGLDETGMLFKFNLL